MPATRASTSGSESGVLSTIVASTGLRPMSRWNFRRSTTVLSALPPGLVIARSMEMSRAGSGRSGYWKAALSTLALSASDGKAFSPYSPFTLAFTATVPEVFTLSKSWA